MSIPTYATMADMSVKKLYKKEWDLTQLYKNEKEIGVHIKQIERAYKAFEKKYRTNKDWLKNQTNLYNALQEYEKLINLQSGRPLRYLSMKRSLNTSDEELQAKLSKVSEQMTHISNRLLFFTLDIGALPKAKQKEYLKSSILKPYRYFLKNVFESSNYQLSEKEEQILNLVSQPAYSAWVDGVEKEQNKLIVIFEGKELPLSAALNLIQTLPKTKRRMLWNQCMEALTSISDFATHEINAIVTDKKIEDNLRGYKKPYSSTALSYQNTEKEVENLVNVVTDNFSIPHRFYELKKNILGLPKLEYADRNAHIGSIKTTFDFESQVTLLKEALQSFGNEYADLFENMFKEGRVDVMPKHGKGGGAFCVCGSTSVPVFMFLNDVETFDSYRTLSHETGHALHGELTKLHTRPFYQSFPTSTAEVASTFFENIAFDRVFEELSPKEQVVALHDKINSSVSTIFRQVALFNFENDLHTRVREEGALSKENILELMNKHMKSYLGNAIELSEKDAYFFVAWSHIRYYFYVYSYAYGELISSAMYEKYKEDPAYEGKIREFLSSGGSMSPKDIFKRVGIDTTDPAFFELGLKKIDKDIRTLKRLAKKVGMLK